MPQTAAMRRLVGSHDVGFSAFVQKPQSCSSSPTQSDGASLGPWSRAATPSSPSWRSRSAPLTQAAIAKMHDELPWFRALSAENRSWIGLIAGNGISSFVEWFRHRTTRTRRCRTTSSAPPHASSPAWSPCSRPSRWCVRRSASSSSRSTPSSTRVTRPRSARRVMLFSREIAFAAAEVYARAAEQRGAWDARLEALIVDSVLRGEADEAVRSRATALGWESASGVCVVLGFTPEGDSADRRRQHQALGPGPALRRALRGAGRPTGRRARRRRRRRQGGRLDRRRTSAPAPSSPARSSATCSPPTCRRGRPSRACGRRRPGRTGRGR